MPLYTGAFFLAEISTYEINTCMKISEALNGLTGLNNNGGEMPRVTKSKKIKKIVAGKKQQNFKRKGPMNIDLSKLGEEEMENKDPILSKLKEKYASKKYAKTSDKNTMKVKPTTGHESPNKMRGKMVGEAPEDTGMYNQDNQRQNVPQKQTAQAQMQTKRDDARQQNIVFSERDFRIWMEQNHSNKTYGAVGQNLARFQMLFQNAQNKAKAEKELNKPATDYSKYNEPAIKRNPPVNTNVSNKPINSPITRANQRLNPVAPKPTK